MYKYLRDNMKYKKDDDEPADRKKNLPTEDIPEQKARLLNIQFFNEFKNLRDEMTNGFKKSPYHNFGKKNPRDQVVFSSAVKTQKNDYD